MSVSPSARLPLAALTVRHVLTVRHRAMSLPCCPNTVWVIINSNINAPILRLNGERFMLTPHLVVNHQTQSSVAFCMPILTYTLRVMFSTVRVLMVSMSATSFLAAPHANNSATCVSRLLNTASCFIIVCFRGVVSLRRVQDSNLWGVVAPNRLATDRNRPLCQLSEKKRWGCITANQ